MECSEKPIFHNYTRQELAQIRITAPEEAVRSLVKKHWDTLAKPLDGMGSFETITAQIGAILGTKQIDLRKKGVLIFCADNGIVEEGVSQTGQEVTLAVAKSMARKGSSVCKMAQSIGAETIPVDIGINSEESIPGVLDRKVRPGTRNFLKEPTRPSVPLPQEPDWYGSVRKKDTVSLPLGKWESATRLPAVR